MEKHIGMTFYWKYNNRHTMISMPECVKKAFHHFQHPTPKKLEHSPSKCVAPMHVSKVQCVNNEPPP